MVPLNVIGRVILAAVFLSAGASHFKIPAKYIEMLPPSVPQRENIILVTGILEILGAIGLMIPRFSHVAGNALILFLICIFPANVHAAFARVEFGGGINGPMLLFIRTPLQMILILWAYLCTGQTWFKWG